MDIKRPWEEAFEWGRVQANRAAAGMPRGPDLGVNGGPFTPDSGTPPPSGGTPPPSGGTPPPRSTYYNPPSNKPQRPGTLKRVFGNPLSLRGGLGYAAAMDLLDAPHDIDNADRIAKGEVEPETLAGRMSLYGGRAAANAQLRVEDALDRPNLRETMSDVRRVTDKLENPLTVPLDRLGDTLKNYYTALGGGVALAKDFVGNLWEGPRSKLPPIGTPGAEQGTPTTSPDGSRSESPTTPSGVPPDNRQTVSANQTIPLNPQLRAATEGWSPEQKARFETSVKGGDYTRASPSEEQAKLLLQSRLAAYDRAFNDTRDMRAMQAGVPRELLNMAGGDLRSARNMQHGFQQAQLYQKARDMGPNQAGLRAAALAATKGGGEGLFGKDVLGFLGDAVKNPEAASMLGALAEDPKASKMTPQQLMANVNLWQRTREAGIPMRPSDIANVHMQQGWNWRAPIESMSWPFDPPARRFNFQGASGYTHRTPYERPGSQEDYIPWELYRRYTGNR